MIPIPDFQLTISIRVYKRSKTTSESMIHFSWEDIFYFFSKSNSCLLKKMAINKVLNSNI